MVVKSVKDGSGENIIDGGELAEIEVTSSPKTFSLFNSPQF